MKIKKIISGALTIVTITSLLLFSNLFFNNVNTAEAATYTWTQSDWSGGSSGSTAVHPTNQTGWTYYSAKDTNLSATTSLALTTTTGTSTQTTDADFNGGTEASTTVSGSGTGASVVLNTYNITLCNNSYTGGLQTCTVPANVTSIIVDMAGAQGGTGTNANAGGNGASVQATLSGLTPGSTLNVYVGNCGGSCSSNGTYGTSGYNGGGSGGTGGGDTAGGGGGATDIRIGGTALSNRVIVAGGGGGRSTSGTGNTGGAGGANGTAGGNDGYGAIGGGGGTQSAGGAGGTAGSGGNAGGSGSSGTGGNGAAAPSTYADNGGAGGGGYYGGGGGNSTAIIVGGAGGGGGGSSCCGSTGCNSSTSGITASGSCSGAPCYTTGYQSNSGYANISYPSYFSSGTFTSSAMNLGTHASIGNFTYTTSGQTASTSIAFKAKSYAAAQTPDFTGCTTLATANSTTPSASVNLSGYSCVNPTDPYIYYQATFNTSDTTVTPSMDEISVSYNYYPSSQTITSSKYDTSSSANLIGGLAWNEDATLPSGTGMTITLTTATTSGELATSTTSVSLTNASSGCSKVGSTVTCSSTAIPASMKDGIGDEWAQYKVTLGSNGINTPTVNNVVVTYAVNAPPEFNTGFSANGVASWQVATTTDANWGKVRIDYSVRDPDTDTDTGSINLVTPSFDYNLQDGTGWHSITSGYLNSGALNAKAVATTSYNTYTAYWDAQSQVPNIATTTAQIRVTVNDQQAALNIASATKSNITLDTTPPAASLASVTFDAGVAGSTNSATITITKPTDVNTVQYFIADDPITASTTNSTDWVNLPSSTFINWTFDSDFEIKNLLFKFRDAYNNVTSTTTTQTTTPVPTSSFLVQDVSKVSIGAWRLYIGWATSTAADFYAYKLEYATSTNNSTYGAYSIAAIITSTSTPYYVHDNLDTTLFYRYRLGVMGGSNSNNVSIRSTAYTTAKPDGVQNYGEGGGGTVATAAKVENVVPTQNADKTVSVSYKLTDSSLSSKISPSYEGYIFYNIGVTLPASAYDGINLTVSDASKMQSSGYIQVNNEVIKYTSKNGNILSGLTRGTWPSFVSSTRATRQNTTFFQGTPVWIMATSTAAISITNSTIATGQTGTISWNTYYETGLAGNTFSNTGVRVLVHDNQDASTGPLSSQSDYSTDATLNTFDLSAPTIQFNATSSSGLESVASVNFPLVLSRAYPVNSTVNYTVTGTATGGGVDYTLANGTATITAGATTTNITATIVNDNLPGPNKTLILTLSSPSNASLGTNTTYTYTINEINFQTVQFTNTSSSVLEASTTVSIPLALGGLSNQNVTVNFSVAASSTASSPANYTLATTTAIIAAGATTTNISVNIADDGIYSKPDKIIIFNLGSASGASLGTNTTYTLTITDNDNSPPEFNSSFGTHGISVYQNATSSDPNLGKVIISYSIRDPNTSTGLVTPALEYNIGSGWHSITASYLAAGDLNDKTVDKSTFIGYTAIWNAQAQIANNYSSAAQIRITLDDKETRNNTTSTTSANFILDTKNPSATLNIDAAQNTITLSASDNSSFQYIVSNNSNLSVDTLNASSTIPSGTWQSATSTIITATSTWAFGSSTYPTVYYQLKDNYGNTTAVTAAVAPSQPTNFSFRDVSNVQLGQYREFLVWDIYTATSSAAFSKYELYRSSDNGSTYSLLASITSVNTNNYTDATVASTTTYYYKLRIVDTDNDTSAYSSTVSDKPDGQGTTFTNPPIISNVQVAETQATWARITWTTDVISTSTVAYSTKTLANYASSTSLASYVTSHEVTISNLTPGTAYVFKVKSRDSFGNEAVNDNSGAGYSFTTLAGPIISDVVVSSITENSATIVWNTDKSSDSYVYYANNSSLTGASTAGSATLVATAFGGYYQHSVTLSNLLSRTKYYFYVQSTDASNNTVADKYDTGTTNYHSFTTSYDTTPPTISNIATPVRTSTAIMILWNTDELADSQVVYGLTSAYGSSSILDTSKTLSHAVALTGLTANTIYHFNLKSNDAAGNLGTSGDQTATTTAANEVITVYVGGGGSVAATDTTPPVISNIKVSDITAFGATITFTTNEAANGFVDYGKDTTYGNTAASSAYSTSHEIKLSGLRLGTIYHFRVVANDRFGNSASSDDQTFTTEYAAEALSNLTSPEKIENASQFQDQLENLIESVMPSLVPPFVSNVSVDDITENSATVNWKTNVPAHGSVVYALDSEYAPTKTNPYSTEISESEGKVSKHSVALTVLSPGTKYHVQAKSFVFPGVIGKSADTIFFTKSSKIRPEIIKIGNTDVELRWTTDKNTSSFVEYRDLKTGQINKTGDNTMSNLHSLRIENLTPDTSYELSAFGYDADNNLIAGDPITIRTKKDVTPPVISSIKIDNAMVPGRTDRLQTVVSWKTDEPANSTVFFEEGVSSSENLANRTGIDRQYTTDHTIIITTFKPATVYRIRVASADESDNFSQSPVRTILTPRSPESVVDIIIRNFQDTFGFLKNLTK